MSKLRLIQCGTGGMGRTWWRSPVRESGDFELVALVDIAAEPLRDAARELNFPGERCFASLESALARVETDAVLTVTPPVVHVEHARLAFSRGLHLLTEKPIAHDMPAAREMVELARRAGRQLVVAQNYRYTAPVQAMKSLLAEQRAGELGHGHIDFYIPADFTGTFRETMEFPLLVDMSIHHIDLIRAVTGCNINRVTTTAFNPRWSWYWHDAGLKMLLELDGGIHVSYSGDWSARGRCTSWNGDWRLQCSDGSIHLEDDKLSIARCDKWGKNPTSEPVEIRPIERSAQAALLQNFARAIRSGTDAETSGQDNLFSFGTVMAAMKSAREGRSIRMSEMVNPLPGGERAG